MPTPAKGPRLGGSAQHERLILRNLAQSLFEHGKIVTTETKAKRLRPYAEKLITTAKRGDLHARREVLKVIRDKNVVHHLFADIAPSFEGRPGGYTRITKTLPRKGDNAPMAIIELITEETVSNAAARVTRRAASAPAPVETPAEVVEETTADEATEAAAEEATEAAAEETEAADEAAEETTEAAAEEK